MHHRYLKNSILVSENLTCYHLHQLTPPTVSPSSVRVLLILPVAYAKTFEAIFNSFFHILYPLEPVYILCDMYAHVLHQKSSSLYHWNAFINWPPSLLLFCSNHPLSLGFSWQPPNSLPTSDLHPFRQNSDGIWAIWFTSCEWSTWGLKVPSQPHGSQEFHILIFFHGSGIILVSIS